MDLRAPLAKLAAHNIFIGTSSWKYPGWLGDIYTEDRCLTRSKLSQKKFDAECLTEYAETFPTVGGDFSFYTFPTADFWQKLFAQVPPSFQFGLKVPEAITVKRWPNHARYGVRKGLDNELFLDAEYFKQRFLNLIEPNRAQVVPLMLEFGSLAKKDFADVGAFAAALDPFLAALPKGWKYAIEIRNDNYLVDDYLRVLRAHNVAHVFSSWTRMPPLDAQVMRDDLWTANFAVCRALLRPGLAYETSVDAFEPFDRIQLEYPEARAALRSLIDKSRKRGEPGYIYVNNRLEGNAPGTISAVIR
ncbi:MAG: DUF72 domain-containing protein [Acidobacteriota bacterium]